MLPHNLQAEKDILWLLITRHTTVPKISVQLEPDDFYNLTNKNNYIIALESYRSDGFVDITKMTKAYEYDSEYVSELWIPKLVKKLKDNAKKRKLVYIAEEINQEVEDGDLDEIIQKIITRTSEIIGDKDVKTDALTIVGKVMQRYEDTKEVDLIGVSTGFHELNDMIGGFQKGFLWVVGGYTNYGKTTFAISLLSHLIKQDQSVLFCSTEMSQEQIIEKLLSNLTRQTPTWNRKNCDQAVVLKGISEIELSKLQVTDTTNTVAQITLKIQEMAANNDLPLVVFVDFIQNIQGPGSNEYERITRAIMELQILARRMNVCIVVLSQVNNQSAKVDSETIGFKSSGALASAADLTIQIVRDKKKEIEAATAGTPTELVEVGLVVQKNRHGRGGYITLEFDITKGLIVGH